MNRGCGALFGDIAFISSILVSKSRLVKMICRCVTIAPLWLYIKTTFLRLLHFGTDRDKLCAVFCMSWTNIFIFYPSLTWKATQHKCSFFLNWKPSWLLTAFSANPKQSEYYSLILIQLSPSTPWFLVNAIKWDCCHSNWTLYVDFILHKEAKSLICVSSTSSLLSLGKLCTDNVM